MFCICLVIQNRFVFRIFNGELICTSDSKIHYCFTGFTDFAFTEFPSIDDGYPTGEYTMRIYSDDTHQLIIEDTCIVY